MAGSLLSFLCFSLPFHPSHSIIILVSLFNDGLAQRLLGI
jgi:hypothetical protein